MIDSGTVARLRNSSNVNEFIPTYLAKNFGIFCLPFLFRGAECHLNRILPLNNVVCCKIVTVFYISLRLISVNKKINLYPRD